MYEEGFNLLKYIKIWGNLSFWCVKRLKKLTDAFNFHG